MYCNFRVYERRVYELNTGARRARLQTSVSISEQTVVPVVKSKVTEVSIKSSDVVLAESWLPTT